MPGDHENDSATLRHSLGGPHLLLLVGIVLIALNLRSPLIAISTVVDPIRADLGVGAGAAGLLTSIPVLCFGLATPLAFALLTKAGVNRAIAVCLVGIVVATAVRSSDGFAVALLGTVVLGIAITIGNVVIPVVIGRDFGSASAVVTAAYTAALNVGSMVTASLTVPVADIVGWRWALISWGLLAVIAGLVWWWANSRRRSGAVRGKRSAAPERTEVHRPALWRRKRAWALTMTFACQAFSYYGITAWLPTILADERGLTRAEAGASSSIFQVLAVVGSFVVPLLLSRGVSMRSNLLIVCGFWIAFPVGLLVAPGLWPVWTASGGIAQGGGITVIFLAIVTQAIDRTDSAGLSAFVQGGGYLVGAIGPFVLGWVHDLSGGWTTPLALVFVILVAMTILGAAATSPVQRR